MNDRAEWHDWRQGGIGASEVAGVVGESPWSSPWSVWASKVGLTKPHDDDAADSMRFGTDLEPVIAAWFHRETGLYVHGEQTWCTHHLHRWARATVDGFVCEQAEDVGLALGVFEAKYTSDAPWDELPRHYWLQVQWQLYVTATERAWLACMHLPFGRPTFRVYEVERDDALIIDLAQRVELFWHAHVVTGDPPDTDAHQATSAAIREVYNAESIEPPDGVSLDATTARAVIVLRDLKLQANEIAAEITACENTVKAYLGSHVEGWADGVRLVSWKPQTAQRLDTTALKVAHPDIYAEFTTPSTSRVLRLDKPKEAT